MVDTNSIIEKVTDLVSSIPDPEIPVIDLGDLGIIRDVKLTEDGELVVVITPTYSGCPATDAIKIQVQMVLLEAGYEKSRVETVLDPPWTTEWISEDGKKKLKEFGIAPPQGKHPDSLSELEEKKVVCPFCQSQNTRVISTFGSTPCKAMFACNECLEPFDYFKCH